MAQLVETLAN